VFWRAVNVMFPAIRYTEVFLDSACFFLMMMMVQMLRIVVISVLLPIVELLELGTCGHLVSIRPSFNCLIHFYKRA
jgi:hypothetical protein